VRRHDNPWSVPIFRQGVIPQRRSHRRAGVLGSQTMDRRFARSGPGSSCPHFHAPARSSRFASAESGRPLPASSLRFRDHPSCPPLALAMALLPLPNLAPRPFVVHNDNTPSMLPHQRPLLRRAGAPACTERQRQSTQEASSVPVRSVRQCTAAILRFV